MKYFFIILFFIGCSFKQDVKPLPSWVLAPPSGISYFYGVGEGWNLQEAKNEALNDLSSKLQVELSSSFSLVVESNYNSYTRVSKSDIFTQVKSLEFDNLKVEKIKQIDETLYVLVKVKKRDFYEKQKNKFLVLDRKINSQMDNLMGISKYEQYLALKSMKSLLKKAIQKTYFLKALKKSFDMKEYLSKYNRLLNLIDTFKSKVIFVVKDNLKYSYFRDIVTKKLNKFGFKTSKQNKDLKAKMSHKVRYFKYKEWYTAKVDTLLEIVSMGKTVQSFQKRVVGKSVSSNKEALLNASKRFDFVF